MMVALMAARLDWLVVRMAELMAAMMVRSNR
jgi:hypothetical protein